MKYFKILLLFLIILSSCKTDKKNISEEQLSSNKTNTDFVIAFGSCNNQNLTNTFWKEILKNSPDVWVWGGDAIYSDTEDMAYLAQNYMKQKRNIDYQYFTKNVDILATWDDHDYGVNDGGAEYPKKAQAQQLFLDFINVPKDDKRRTQEGVYFSKDFIIGAKSIKIILLDTRYFRTALTDDKVSKKRYKPTLDSTATMLGKKQWEWLQKELENSNASFNIMMSSIQFLSCEHGFETWGNMPLEVKKMEKLLVDSKAKNTIILSGDRHISEFSQKEVSGLKYPLIDFTSSGLTHSYSNFHGEDNKYRVGNVVSKKSFGILKIDFENNSVLMEMRGENNKLYETLTHKF